MTSPREAALAREVLAELDGPHGRLSVERDGGHRGSVPREVGVILQQVLEAMARGGTVTVSAIPEELTTSAAAAVLGISRPTVMKMVADGHLASHKVGTHTRFRADDVLAERRARRARERAAFDALRDLEDE